MSTVQQEKQESEKGSKSEKQFSSDTVNEEVESRTNKSWTGLYKRWKSQLEGDFEEDPSQKWKLYLGGSMAAILPILFLTLPMIPFLIFIGTFYLFTTKIEKSIMVNSTILIILYSSIFLITPIVGILAVILNKYFFKNSFF